MGAINVSATMQAVADRLVAAAVVTNAYGWPVRSVKPPAAIVGYPDELEFDVTFGRGSDRAVIPIWIVCGNVHDKTARDTLSGYIAGATGVKDALDGDLGGAVQTARVTDCQIEKIDIGGVEYISARFDLEVFS